MNSKLLSEQGPRVFALVFDTGDEVMGGLTSFMEENGVATAQLTGIGALSLAVVGSFSFEDKDYRLTRIEEQLELLSLLGNVTLFENKPRVHVHVTLARQYGSALGGHLMEGNVRPTLEVIVQELPGRIERQPGPIAALPLISL